MTGSDSDTSASFGFRESDQHLFAKGHHYEIYRKLGAHACIHDQVDGVNFAVWAPHAEDVSVVSPFNHWEGRCHQMKCHGLSGVWELFIPGLTVGEPYKFAIRSSNGRTFLKSDPYAFRTEVPPNTASIVYRLEDAHLWRDEQWMHRRRQSNVWEQPIAIYEVHLGSWLRGPNNGLLSYRELAEKLIPYVKSMAFTHIEILPIAEYPYEPSWGYQVTNYYAPTARYGTPADLMEFIDRCHQNEIGVILDWVAGHFPKDPHGLAFFDGSCLYEYADPRQREHRDWGTLLFNYGRPEVENFLIANALYWLDNYHFDGLRVDAVTSMLYLDYSRTDSSEWVSNIYGGKENLEAIEFLKRLNTVVHEKFSGVIMVAEESTAWPRVSRPIEQGGLGFGFKWNMGWMHDVVGYMRQDPTHRKYYHGHLTFGLHYAFDENFILSLSHDEVVHLKGSLLSKMPGDEWQKFASLRLLYIFMYGHPGKKLLFMGGEFGQWGEWDHSKSLEWYLLERKLHRDLQRFVMNLNRLYRTEKALYEVDFASSGFEWIDVDSADQSVLAFRRKAKDPQDSSILIMNFANLRHEQYRVGVPYPGFYCELLNSDAVEYGGRGHILGKRGVKAQELSWHGCPFSVTVTLPPLSGMILQPLHDKTPVLS